jgi:hypothetical protein
VQVNWCGEGVPERQKGLFSKSVGLVSHFAARTPFSYPSHPLALSHRYGILIHHCIHNCPA